MDAWARGPAGMRLVICMPLLCPWSQSVADSLRAMGSDVFVFDFARRSERGLVSSQIDGIQADADGFRRRLAGLKLMPAISRDRFQYLLRAYQLRRYARSVEADMVLAFSAAGYSFMAYVSGFRPFAAYAIGSDVLLADRVERWRNRRVLHAAAVVFVNGGYLAGQTREQAPRANVVPLLMGIDLGAFRLADLAARPIQMICTRGFEDIYNNEAIIQALARLPPNAPDFRLVFVSGGERLASCIELADRVLPASVRRRVVFLGGVAKSALLEELHRSHILVSMSRSDGTATSLLEGLACGLYPVLSDIPQNREWIDPARGNGELVQLGDEGALASALTRAIGSVSHGPSHAHVEFNRRQVETRADAVGNRALLLDHLKKAVRTQGA